MSVYKIEMQFHFRNAQSSLLIQEQNEAHCIAFDTVSYLHLPSSRLFSHFPESPNPENTYMLGVGTVANTQVTTKMEDKSPSTCRLCDVPLAGPEVWRQHAKSEWQ